MGKVTLAQNLGQKFGKSTEEASRFIDEVGFGRAQRAADEGADEAGLVEKWWKPTAAGTGLVGGGALVWRQQDIQQAKQIAKQSQADSTGVESIMDSDLPPKKKQQLLDRYFDAQESRNSDGGDDGGGDWLPELPDFLSGTQGTVLIMVVLVVVLQTTLGDDS